MIAEIAANNLHHEDAFAETAQRRRPLSETKSREIAAVAGSLKKFGGNKSSP